MQASILFADLKTQRMNEFLKYLLTYHCRYAYVDSIRTTIIKNDDIYIKVFGLKDHNLGWCFDNTPCLYLIWYSIIRLLITNDVTLQILGQKLRRQYILAMAFQVNDAIQNNNYIFFYIQYIIYIIPFDFHKFHELFLL